VNIVERAKNIVLRPRQEWAVIEAEGHSVQGLYTTYVMLLAAIPAVAGFIGVSIVGFGGLGSPYRVPIAAGVANMILAYILNLGSVYGVAVVIDTLAPEFGARRDFVQSLKVAAFAPTAVWLAGASQFLPVLSILMMAGGLCSLYALYLGLMQLKRPPADKAVPYAMLVVIVAMVVGVAATAIPALAIPSPLRGF
jgi:hypothetical protein